MQISVGRMKYDSQKGRGVVDGSYERKKVFMNKDASYQSVLSLLKEATYSEAEEDGKYM